MKPDILDDLWARMGALGPEGIRALERRITSLQQDLREGRIDLGRFRRELEALGLTLERIEKLITEATLHR